MIAACPLGPKDDLGLLLLCVRTPREEFNDTVAAAAKTARRVHVYSIGLEAQPNAGLANEPSKLGVDMLITVPQKGRIVP